MNPITEPDVDLMDRGDDEAAADVGALALQRPSTPATLDALAVYEAKSEAIVDARVAIVTTMRRASIRLTSPADWVLNRAPDGNVTGFVSDAGAQRYRPLWGIDIVNVRNERIATADGFMYVYTADGDCKFTGQRVEQREGGRSSTEKFCEGKRGAELELLVRKAGRANCDGTIVRELSGMKSVPVEEIAAAWVGTDKRVDQCHKGHGFGTADERRGAPPLHVPNVEKPKCDACGAEARYMAGKDNRGPWWGCPDWNKHPQRKWSIAHDKWLDELARRTPAPAPPPATRPLTDDDIPFGG